MRVGRLGAGILGLIASVMLLGSCVDSCVEPPPGWECYHDLACPLTMRCVDTKCVCGDNRLEFCCSKFDTDPDCKPTCLYKESCRLDPDGGMGGAGGVGGAGGSVGGAGGAGGIVVAECAVDADCAQPPDRRCGAGTCLDGVCSLEVKPGAIPSQVYGDCKQLVCDVEGNVVTLADSSDVYEDGRACTYDFCENGEPKSMPLTDGYVCPVTGIGVCHEGECVECIDSIQGANDCHDPGLYCSELWCVPSNPCSNSPGCGGLCKPCAIGFGCTYDIDCIHQTCLSGTCQLPTCDDGKKNGQETDIDCGQPSCPLCPDGAGCVNPSDCVSDVCKMGQCQPPTCVDGKQNGTESGVDCGGVCDPC